MDYRKWLDENFGGDKATALFVLKDGIKFFTALKNDKKQALFAAAKIEESKKYIRALQEL